MGRTIIQPIGPLYGESVNGTVFGRPNGSVYVPGSNRITLTIADASVVKVVSGNSIIGVYSPDWELYAESQDMASYVQRQVFSDAECTTMIAASNMNAGVFNAKSQWFGVILDLDNPPESGDTVYMRAQLMSSTNVPVATSDVYEKVIQ